MTKKSFWQDDTLNNFLSRSQRKWIGLALIGLAILLAIPPIFPDPTDILLNIPIATLLVNSFGVGELQALVLTYTLIPLIIFVVKDSVEENIYQYYKIILKKELNKNKKIKYLHLL